MRKWALLVCALAAGAFASTAAASQVISTSTVTGLTLTVNGKGEALLSYRSQGKVVHVLAWGAVNAVAPSPGGKQVAFKLDYSGGYAKYFRDNPMAQDLVKQYKRIRSTQGYLSNPIVKKLQHVQQAADFYWRDGFNGACGKYTGPQLAWAVAACTAPDGSYWAVQEWQRKLPDYGLVGSASSKAMEVHLAHWTGALPVLKIATDWSWHRWDHLFGTLDYAGAPVFGYKSTSTGQPLDSFGRNVYVDTLNSAYGKGWRRENSFLTHKGDGVFCYSVNPHGSHPAGTGIQYRATIIGPGVAPDVMWSGASPGAYSKSADAEANLAIASLHDALCKPN